MTHAAALPARISASISAGAPSIRSEPGSAISCSSAAGTLISRTTSPRRPSCVRSSPARRSNASTAPTHGSSTWPGTWPVTTSAGRGRVQRVPSTMSSPRTWWPRVRRPRRSSPMSCSTWLVAGTSGIGSLAASPPLARAVLRDRQVLSARYFQGRSVKDIGLEHGARPETAKVWLYRARGRLRTRIERFVTEREALTAPGADVALASIGGPPGDPGRMGSEHRRPPGGADPCDRGAALDRRSGDRSGPLSRLPPPEMPKDVAFGVRHAFERPPLARSQKGWRPRRAPGAKATSTRRSASTATSPTRRARAPTIDPWPRCGGRDCASSVANGAGSSISSGGSRRARTQRGSRAPR